MVRAGLTLDVLESIPVPASVISPRENAAGNIVDFEIAIANKPMRGLIAQATEFSTVLAEDHLSALIRDLEKVRGASTLVRSRLRFSVTHARLESEYQLDSRWHGDSVIVVATSFAPLAPVSQNVASAAEIIVKAMPEMPIAYGVLADGHWRRFATESFLHGLDMTGPQFENLPMGDLASDDYLTQLQERLESTEDNRVSPFIFQARAVHGSDPSGGRWLKLRMTHIAPEGHPEHEATHEGVKALKPDFFTLRDIDEEIRLRKASEDALSRLDMQFGVLSSALNASRDGFSIWKGRRDSAGEIRSFELEFMNDAGAAPTGKKSRHLIGSSVEDVHGETESKDLMDLFSLALTSHKVQLRTLQINSSAGWVGAYQTQVVPFSNDQVLTSFRDVSEDQRERDRLNWLAEHDHLTGLPNRRNLEEILQSSLDRVRGSNAFVAFAFVDIDDFKRVNDTHGHDVGDDLLRAFGQRMGLALGDVGVVARLAGDEFGLVIDSVPSEAKLQLNLNTMMEQLRQPFDNLAKPLTVSCSAGVALCAGEEPISEVLRIADKAMYRAKHDGKNRFHVVHI